MNAEVVDSMYGIFVRTKVEGMKRRFPWAFEHPKSEFTKIETQEDLVEGRFYIIDNMSPNQKIRLGIHGGVFGFLYHQNSLYFPGQDHSKLPYVENLPETLTLRNLLEMKLGFSERIVGGYIDTNPSKIQIFIENSNKERFQSIEELIRRNFSN